MTFDLTFLLVCLVFFLIIAIGGLSYFLFRISQFRREAEALSDRIVEVKTEIATVQADIHHLFKRMQEHR